MYILNFLHIHSRKILFVHADSPILDTFLTSPCFQKKVTEALYFHGPATLEQLVPRKYGKLPAHGRQPPKRHAQLIGDHARNLRTK